VELTDFAQVSRNRHVLGLTASGRRSGGVVDDDEGRGLVQDEGREDLPRLCAASTYAWMD